ncbi:MAG: HAMP domain-containing histidine kinase [Lachnospiraceae bacterium]|nr:HAMP domain-containing histidine kinase [Lachnospiraceae bacterium]
MKYLLIVSLLFNLLFLLKIVAVRKSVRNLRTDFSAVSGLDSNIILGVTGRDKEICRLVSSMNEVLVRLRESHNKYMLGDAELKTAITNIAHDLRTPLTAICGYLEIAMKKDMDDELRKYLSIIDERAVYMKGLTEEMFEFSILSSGEVTEEKQEIFLNRMLEDCVMNYYPALMERGIEPVVEITESRVVRSLYPSYTERIFNNLISNALKYSAGDLEISLSEDGVFTIANSAPSLSGVEVGKLFDRFFTVENARKNAGGLGLSIVKTLAARMDCALKARYEEGRLIIEIDF